jgi:hypothetical protein
VWLKKERGESGVGPHWWPADGAVIEVPDHLAHDLLAIPDGGYSAADPPPKPAPKAAAKTEAPAEPKAPPAVKA